MDSLEQERLEKLKLGRKKVVLRVIQLEQFQKKRKGRNVTPAVGGPSPYGQPPPLPVKSETAQSPVEKKEEKHEKTEIKREKSQIPKEQVVPASPGRKKTGGFLDGIISAVNTIVDSYNEQTITQQEPVVPAPAPEPQDQGDFALPEQFYTIQNENFNPGVYQNEVYQGYTGYQTESYDQSQTEVLDQQHGLVYSQAPEFDYSQGQGMESSDVEYTQAHGMEYNQAQGMEYTQAQGMEYNQAQEYNTHAYPSEYQGEYSAADASIGQEYAEQGYTEYQEGYQGFEYTPQNYDDYYPKPGKSLKDQDAHSFDDVPIFLANQEQPSGLDSSTTGLFVEAPPAQEEAKPNDDEWYQQWVNKINTLSDPNPINDQPIKSQEQESIPYFDKNAMGSSEFDHLPQVDSFDALTRGEYTASGGLANGYSGNEPSTFQPNNYQYSVPVVSPAQESPSGLEAISEKSLGSRRGSGSIILAEKKSFNANERRNSQTSHSQSSLPLRRGSQSSMTSSRRTSTTPTEKKTFSETRSSIERKSSFHERAPSSLEKKPSFQEKRANKATSPVDQKPMESGDNSLQKQRELEDKEIELTNKSLALSEKENKLRILETRIGMDAERVGALQREYEAKNAALFEREEAIKKEKQSISHKIEAFETEKRGWEEKVHLVEKKAAFLKGEEERVVALGRKVAGERGELQRLEASLARTKKELEERSKVIEAREINSVKRMKALEDKESDLERMRVFVKSESEKYEALEKELDRQRAQVSREQQTLQEKLIDYESRLKELLKREDQVRNETKGLETRESVVQKRLESLEQRENLVEKNEAQLKAKAKQIEQEMAQFESKRSTFSKDAEYIEERTKRLVAAQNELKAKQVSIQEENGKVQALLSMLGKERLALEKERSLLFEKEKDVKRREAQLTRNGDNGNLSVLREQIEREKELVDRERQELLTRQADILRMEEESMKRAEANSRESERLAEATRAVEVERGSFVKKERQLNQLIADFGKKQKELEAQNLRIFEAKNSLEKERQLLGLRLKEFEEEKRKVREALLLKSKGESLEAAKKMLEGELSHVAREKDARIRQLEEELFVYKKRGTVTREGSDSKSSLGYLEKKASLATDSKRTLLTSEQIATLQRVASQELKSADLNEIAANKDKYELLNAIVSLASTNQNLSKQLEKAQIEGIQQTPSIAGSVASSTAAAYRQTQNQFIDKHHAGQFMDKRHPMVSDLETTLRKSRSALSLMQQTEIPDDHLQYRTQHEFAPSGRIPRKPSRNSMRSEVNELRGRAWDQATEPNRSRYTSINSGIRLRGPPSEYAPKPHYQPEVSSRVHYQPEPKPHYLSDKHYQTSKPHPQKPPEVGIQSYFGKEIEGLSGIGKKYVLGENSQA